MLFQSEPSRDTYFLSSYVTLGAGLRGEGHGTFSPLFTCTVIFHPESQWPFLHVPVGHLSVAKDPC